MIRPLALLASPPRPDRRRGRDDAAEAPAHQGGGARALPSPRHGHGAGAAPRRLRAAPGDGEGLAAPGPALPQRGPRGAGRPHRGHRGAGRASRRAAGGLRLRRPLAHRQPRRELDAAVRRGVVHDHRRRGGGRRRGPGALRRHRGEQLEPHLVRRHRRLQDHRRRTDLEQPRASPTRTTSGAWSWTPRSPHASSSPPSATSTRRTRSAASTSPPTAARPGRGCSSWTSARVRSTSCRTRAGPTCSTPPPGSARARPELPGERAGQRDLEVDRRGRAPGRAWAGASPPAPPSAASASRWPRRARRPSTR